MLLDWEYLLFTIPISISLLLVLLLSIELLLLLELSLSLKLTTSLNEFLIGSSIVILESLDFVNELILSLIVVLISS